MINWYSSTFPAVLTAACLSHLVAGQALAVQLTTTNFGPPSGFGYVADGALFEDSPFLELDVVEIRVFWDVEVAAGSDAALIQGYMNLPIYVGQNPITTFNLSGDVNGWSGSGTFNYRKTVNTPNMKFGDAWTFFSQSVLVPQGFDANILPGSRVEIDYIAPPAPGDLDDDGDVDDVDFGLIFAVFTGPNNGPPTSAAADLDNDNDVDDADFGLAFAAFTGPGGPASVPEPASLALILPGMLLLRRRR